MAIHYYNNSYNFRQGLVAFIVVVFAILVTELIVKRIYDALA